MKAIELHKFITENSQEYRRTNDYVLLFVDNRVINDFYKLLDPGIFDDDGLTCAMKDGYFVFDMDDICGYYGIDIDEVFIKENN